MSIKKHENGWLVDVRPTGKYGKRYRKKFARKAEAIRWEAWIIGQKTANPEWEPPRRDIRRLSELCELWFAAHGQHLKDGKKRFSKLKRICEGLGNPIASEFKANDFILWRSAKGDSVSANTLNHDLAYLKAVFNQLLKLGEAKENPLENIQPLKIDEPELTFLQDYQITQLLEALARRRNPDVIKIAKLCLATGARWSEAETIERSAVRRYSVTFHRTKSGKSRTVPISEQLYDEMMCDVRGERLFKSSYNSFTNGLHDSGLQLPKGQRTHVLRHTFASHFIMNGGNLLTLQKILGHQSIAMTMRYAHLAPEHLNEAVQFNPLECKRDR